MEVKVQKLKKSFCFVDCHISSLCFLLKGLLKEILILKRKGFQNDSSVQDEVFFQVNEFTEYVILPDLGLFFI